MHKDVEKIIKNAVEKDDYVKGLRFRREWVELTDTKEGNWLFYYFNVRSESTLSDYYSVLVAMDADCDIVGTRCHCPQFFRMHSCKHVAAALIHHADVLFRKYYETAEDRTKRIMEALKANVSVHSAKKRQEVFLIPSIEFSYYKYRDEYDIILKMKIGIDKKYQLGAKLNNFITAYNRGEAYKFGKDFTYDPDIHYFGDSSKKFWNFIRSLGNYFGRDIMLSDESFDEFLEICGDSIYIENFACQAKIKHEFPYECNLHKEDGSYTLDIGSGIKDTIILTEDKKILYYKKAIYKLNKAQVVLFNSCVREKIDELKFNESDFKSFEESLIPVLKDKIKTDESTKDIIIVNKPRIRLYFDILENTVTCDPRFLHGNSEISVFDTKTNIIRDIDSEVEVEEMLYSYKFEKGKKNFVLTELEEMCYLLEKGFDEIAEKYEVYTSEKLKNTNIIKNNTISSTFSIGKDNILRYTFDLGKIDESELANIMDSVSEKKKYYRLKSGDIIFLEEETIQELHDLSEDLSLGELTPNGTIPKYRALYLDFLKENKYGIIKTDSLFQNFIDQFNKYKENRLTLTKEEKEVLRDYQEEGVKWLYTIKKCGFGGILADEMGLGKSAQTIFFIKKLIEENKDSKYLIVCPTSLIYNWENEFKKFAPELDFHVFAGMRANRIQELEAYKGNIYITTYGLLREDLEYYEKISFEVSVIDEAQNIKNPKTGLTKAVKSIDAVTKIALTGTPIENSIVELWSIFDYMMPGFLSNLMNFQKKYKIKDVEGDNSVIDNLKSQVKPFILRRKKKDVMEDLPDKIENNIFIDLNEEQKKVYAAEVESVREQMEDIIKKGTFKKEQFLILSLLTRLRQICIEPSIVYKNYKGGSSKVENLIKIVKEVTENGHKILLFTSFRTALDIVKNELDKESISNYTIAGDVSSKERQRLVDAFNKDNTKVFLIMLKSGGTGLNLTSADVVIHLDLWWNPQVENQATDRAHRIGQKNTVEVVKLICKGTIEEKILELQDKKKLLSEKLLEKDMDDSKYLNQLDENDIKNLITYNNE